MGILQDVASGNATESTIFEALVDWMRKNQEYSLVFPKLLKHIDLYLVDEELVDMLFKPTELIDRTLLQVLLKEQQEKANKVQKFVNQNVINGTDDIRVIEGYKHWLELSDELLFSSTRQNNVVVDLKQQCVLNCLKLNLRYVASYIISVSKNTRDWECVVDHLKYNCSGPQVLYFKERAFRFICIHCSSSIDNIEVLYSTNIFEIDPNTTLIVPSENVVPTEMLFRWDSNTVGCLISGIPVINTHVVHMIGNQRCIIYQFFQPYVIESVKVLLNDTCSYYIAISTNKNCWTSVFEEENVTGWRIATFKKQPVMFIKIVGTKAPSKCFKLYKLECPAT
uniref:BACK domain-containing protein n=1 Tax=Panagrellus redivivus TaxID=6233 RepID=A0A7E4W6V7_PANRE